MQYKFRRDVDHKLRVLRHADQIGDVGKACRYFGVGRASFYRWRGAYRQHGVLPLRNARQLRICKHEERLLPAMSLPAAFSNGVAQRM